MEHGTYCSSIQIVLLLIYLYLSNSITYHIVYNHIIILLILTVYYFIIKIPLLLQEWFILMRKASSFLEHKHNKGNIFVFYYFFP